MKYSLIDSAFVIANNQIHFAALDNRLDETLNNDFLFTLGNLYAEESFSYRDTQNILDAAKNLVVKYTDIKYRDLGLIETPYSLFKLASLMSITSLNIVLKWLCEYDCETELYLDGTLVTTKEICALEMDILKTFDYNIFRFMPIRSPDDFIKGTQVIPDPKTPPIPKHLQPTPIIEPLVSSTSCTNPWSCLCKECEDRLSSLGYPDGLLDPYPEMTKKDFWNHFFHVLKWQDSFSKKNYKARTRAIARQYRMFKGNPSRWYDNDREMRARIKASIITGMTDWKYKPLSKVQLLFAESLDEM